MGQAVEIVRDVVSQIRELMNREDLRDYYPLIKTEDGPEIKYFGGVRIETRQTPKGPDTFYMLRRNYGWVVALVVTREGKVVLNIQPKPGLAVASLEMPAGGIGKDPKRTQAGIIQLTQDQVLKETGYGNAMETHYLGFSIIESGKEFDPAVEPPFEPGVGRGLKAHLVLLKGVERVAEQQLASTDKIQPILVSRDGLIDLVKNNVLVETSAVNCVALALLNNLI